MVAVLVIVFGREEDDGEAVPVLVLCIVVRAVAVLGTAAGDGDVAVTDDAVVCSTSGAIVRVCTSSRVVRAAAVVSETAAAAAATVTGRADGGGRRVGVLVYVTDGVGRCWKCEIVF